MDTIKKWEYALAALIIVPMIFVTASAASAGKKYRILMMMGDVRVVAGGAARAASFGEMLAGGETIITGSGSFADISMDGRGYMRIQEKSKVSLAALTKKSGDPDLDMESGNVIVIMSKLKKDDSYGVKTSTNVASVRGTMFQVAGDEATSEVNVFSGTVLVNPVSNGEIQRQIAEMVTEGRSLALNKDFVMDLMAKKKTMKLSEIRREVRDSFMKQIGEIQATPDYKNQSAELRKEIDGRIQRFRQELKDKKLDPESLKEKIKNERERQKKELERIRDEMRGK